VMHAHQIAAILNQSLIHLRQPDGLARINTLQDLRVLDDDRAVDHDVGNAGGRQSTICRGRNLLDRVGIENGDVRIGADLEAPLVGHLRDAVVLHELGRHIGSSARILRWRSWWEAMQVGINMDPYPLAPIGCSPRSF